MLSPRNRIVQFGMSYSGNSNRTVRLYFCTHLFPLVLRSQQGLIMKHNFSADRDTQINLLYVHVTRQQTHLRSLHFSKDR